MKKVILIMAVAAVFAFTGSVMASPPVCPPFEGFLIETSTSMVVFGNASEEETFDWKWNNDNCEGTTNGLENDLQAGESVGRISYSENFSSLNGLAHAEGVAPTTFLKEFSANSHTDTDLASNVTVKKDIGYTSDAQAGHHAAFKEIASVEVVSAGGVFKTGSMFTGVLALCPWAPTPSTKEWPATNEGIAMGSAFAIPATLLNGDPGYIDFASTTAADITNRVALSYDVNANGKGQIQAEMVVKLWEGSTIQSQKNPAATPLNSVVTYTEKAEANGIFTTFHKGMNYSAKFALPDVTPISFDILQ